MTTSPLDALPDAPASDIAAGGQVKNGRKRWLVVFSILFVFVAAVLWIVLHAGTWLVVQDPLAPAQVIVVLSGRMPERAIEAARLYKQNAAPEVWVSQPASPISELKEMHIPFVGEDFYNERVLLALSVPADSVRIFPQPSANTEQEIEEIGRLTRGTGIRTVIIVTSSPHTRRVRAIWNRLIGDSPRLIVRHPVDDPFNAGRWWRNTQDALDVVREWLGLANAWAGFPSRPDAN
jgi:uncharacterized SAM-binding protein YcdF (DUF218 family)